MLLEEKKVLASEPKGAFLATVGVLAVTMVVGLSLISLLSLLVGSLQDSEVLAHQNVVPALLVACKNEKVYSSMTEKPSVSNFYQIGT